jgi:hypothetical protein
MISSNARESWLTLRQRLGDTHDRLGTIRLISAATGYVPLPHQLRAHLAGAGPGQTSFKLFCAGVGSGKTLFSVYELLAYAIMNPGCSGIALGPTFDLCVSTLLPEFEAAVEKMHAAGYPIVRRFVRSRLEAELVCGGNIAWRSFSKIENMRGRTCAYATIDESEVSFDPGYIWNVLQGRLRDPRARVRGLWATTTPKGLRGIPALFVERRHEARGLPPAERNTELRRWFTIKASSLSNTHLPSDYIKNMERSYSKRMFRAEVMGDVLKPQAAVFQWNRDSHVRPYQHNVQTPYAISCDWGHSNPHALFIAELPDGALIVFDEMCPEGGTSSHRFRQMIVDRCAQYGRPPQWAIGDRAVRSEMSWLMGQFPAAHVSRMRSREEQSIVSGIAVVNSLLDPVQGDAMLYLSSGVAARQDRRALVKAMLNYRYKQKSDGTIDTMRPYKDSITDHAADCLRMACVVLAEQGRATFTLDRTHGRKRTSRLGPGRGFTR